MSNNSINAISAITLLDQVGATSASGGLISNYALPTLNASNAPVTITPRALTASLTNTAVSKVYDGTTSAPSGFAPTYQFTGLLAGESAVISHASSAYDNSNVLQATRLTLSGLGLTSVSGSYGSQVSDYALGTASADVAATITPRPFSVSGLTIVSREYDGTTTAAVTGTAVLGGILNADQAQVNVAGNPTVANFVDANAGVNKAVNLTGLTLGGAAASNYTTNGINGLTGTVTPKTLAITGSSVASKVYDGTTSAIATAGTLQGLVGSETLTVSASAAFGSRNAGSYAVNTSYTLGNGSNGGLAANYALASQALSASITPKALTITGSSAAGKVYDGNSIATVMPGSVQGLVGNETVAGLQSQLEGYLVALGILAPGQTLTAQESAPTTELDEPALEH
ncbi:MAG: hypothetical protein KGN78_13975 [Actinomycetales bacterium]|nr:hypothetical protein [Actinomycetales bacterium]